MMGKRGEGWFALQLILFALILLLPDVLPLPFPLWLRAAGVVILLAGGFLGSAGLWSLGANASPFPMPIPGGQLVTRGAYRFVRHPIYAGLILGTLGWALLNGNILGVGLAVIVFLFFDAKSRQEEVWLNETYPGYAEYRRRVKKLIPWVY